MLGMTLSSACSNTAIGLCLVLPSMISNASYTIFSATDFLPACMIEFMNLVTTTFPYFGSGMISRFSALWRRDIGSVLCFVLPDLVHTLVMAALVPAIHVFRLAIP